MPSALEAYLAQRADTAMFLLPQHLRRTLDELFPQTESTLPQPYRIYPADETQQPILGFPLAETGLIRELDAKLDRWLTEEVLWQVGRQPAAREKALAMETLYVTQLMRAAENALMSNLLNDYHAVFWLAHSFDMARHFSSIPRRVSAVDANAGRTQGDALKYRIFSKWVSNTREQMSQLAGKAASMMDGEEQRAQQFFRLLQDDVLILTEEFIGPDLRELRSFVNGYLRRDFQAFRDGFEKLRTATTDLMMKDRMFRAALPLFGVNPDQPVAPAVLLDARFLNFFFENPSVQNLLSREDREQFQLIARRLREFAVLNQLRRGIQWMTVTEDGEVVAADKRNGVALKYSRSTRPLDFGRAGVVDPMIHRFGLIYDISSFTETLGNIRRAGGKEELKSYRQMLLFQKKLDAIAQRHLLQFEKFLGDGAFYTTRRALRLVRAAVEIQRFYTEMKRKGFAFNKGIRLALNYGYYRLLPMKTSADTHERLTEFYGPGIVELSRLTTGKASKEIQEIASFLVTHGYDPARVETFFAPLSKGVDVIDHAQHAREYYAYVNANGHLVNEGIVASMALLQELSADLSAEGQQLYRLRSAAGSYIGFSPAVTGMEWVGVKLLGMVSLKGLDDIEVGEIVSFAAGEAEATLIETSDALVPLLRQDLHQPDMVGVIQPDVAEAETKESQIAKEIVICMKAESEDSFDEVLIGEWDPRSDDVHRPLLIPRGDFQRLFALPGALTTEKLMVQRDSVRQTYARLSEHDPAPDVRLATYRLHHGSEAFVVGDVVEKL